MPDLRPFLSSVPTIVARHALAEPGAYARFSLPETWGAAGVAAGEADPYGCADAINLFYTLNFLPSGDEDRAALVGALQALQSREDGLFREATHHPIHTTAHCLAALELLDARGAVPLTGLSGLGDPGAMEAFLEGLDWSDNPWIESHRGAGLYAALWLAGELSDEWVERYFRWLARECDGETGLLRRGAKGTRSDGELLRFPALAGTFHYLFNQQHTGRPVSHPERLIDTCLDIEERSLFPFSTFVGFAEVDWIYSLHRALRECGHRREEATRALRRFGERHVAFLATLDPATDKGLDDLHSLFGTVCALAELQNALPEDFPSEVPLRLVLDRRPFI